MKIKADIDNGAIYDTIAVMTIDEAIKALASEQNIKFKDLLKICEEFFKGPKIEGSHHIFKTPWTGKPWINIQKDKKMAKGYQVKQVKEALTKLKEINEKAEKEKADEKAKRTGK